MVVPCAITHRSVRVAVSEGPGAINVSHAVHLAFDDAAPLIVLIGSPHAKSAAGRRLAVVSKKVVQPEPWCLVSQG